MLDGRKNNEGMALLFVMMAIIVILGSLGMLVARVASEQRNTTHAFDTVVLEEAAKAGIDYAIQELWHEYIVNNGNTTGNWASYRYFLNNISSIPNTEDLNGNGQKDEGEKDLDGYKGWETWPGEYGEHGYPLIDEPIQLTAADSARVIATINSIDVIRTDYGFGSDLTIRAEATADGKTKAAVQHLRIGGQPFNHAAFAILANDITCILCHADFRSLPLEYNRDPDLYNEFDRIKVASLSSLLVRKDEADSYIAGTLYSRGKVYQQNGAEYTASQLAASQLRGRKISGDNGKIVQGGTGGMSTVSLQNATTNENGELTPFANLYLDYPKEDDQMTDGPLPDSFPAPFPDDDNDRIVDDEEFEAAFNRADGSIDFEYAGEDVPGSIKAGVAYGVPHGSNYTGSGFPAGSTSDALASLESTGTYDGNLILIGTEDDPIIVDKKVAVNGDLLLRGPVKGRGQILARGNVYIMGDVTYADAPGEFGVAEDGAENAFAVVAGGSMFMGDYLTVRGVNHSAKNNDKFPDWTKYSIHTRDDYASNSVTINNKKETLKWGYFDPYSVDAGEIVSGRQGQQYSFATSELMLFNRLELNKALADPDYQPRFYGLRDSQPDNIYYYDASDEHAVKYNESGVKLLLDFMMDEDINPSVYENATFHYCNPANNWISENQLRKMWFADEMSRNSGGDPFKLDGLYYSNNAIFANVRSPTRHKSYTDGQMVMRGGLIAADLGIFVPEGFTLLYDPRVERFLDIEDATEVSPRRRAFYYVAGDTAGGAGEQG